MTVRRRRKKNVFFLSGMIFFFFFCVSSSSLLSKKKKKKISSRSAFISIAFFFEYCCETIRLHLTRSCFATTSTNNTNNKTTTTTAANKKINTTNATTTTAPSGRVPENGGKLPSIVHRGTRIRVQSVAVSSRHSWLHVPRRGFYEPKRNGREVHLREQVRGRKLYAQAHGTRDFVHGQRRAEHERVAVFLVHGGDVVVEREALRVWKA